MNITVVARGTGEFSSETEVSGRVVDADGGRFEFLSDGVRFRVEEADNGDELLSARTGGRDRHYYGVVESVEVDV